MKKLLLCLLLLPLLAHAQGIPGNQSIVTLGVQGASLPNFTVASPPQPVVTVSTSSGTLGTGQYSVRLAFVVTATSTPTLPSVSTVAVLPAAGNLSIASPTCPSGVATYNVYIGTAVGNETQQGSATTCGTAFSQSSAISAGSALPSFTLVPLTINSLGQLVAAAPSNASDPCASSGIAKSSVVISVTSATTTSLVALSGTTSIYVCGFSLTISQVVTTANTIQFEYGTGATCGTGTTALTGTYGAGGVTASAPLSVSYGGGGTTIFTAPSGNRLCAVTAIGASGSFQGVLTYVQQ